MYTSSVLKILNVLLCDPHSSKVKSSLLRTWTLRCLILARKNVFLKNNCRERILSVWRKECMEPIPEPWETMLEFGYPNMKNLEPFHPYCGPMPGFEQKR